ncbi:MAG: DUF4350 domain-containing protein [Archangiaceae bacterium]|nr:DUF4350 domain-containing protein [Archangiaceae bacterium]
MSRFGAWPLFGVLLLLALAVGLAGGGDAPTSVRPTVNNSGPHGLKVLHTWLKERGADIRVGEGPLGQAPANVATIVIAAPVATPFTDEDVQALRTRLEAGATVVLMVARDTRKQVFRPLINLKTIAGASIAPVPFDGAGATLEVALPIGPLRNVKSLRVSIDPSLEALDPDAISLTIPEALWARRIGKGTLFVSAGPDLAENARLGLADNARFWANLAAAGPMYFDESHHVARTLQAPTVNLWAPGLQFLFAAAIFVVGRGTRLGRPRAEPPPALRSSTEYVEAMARLTQRAKLEPELIEALRRQLRLTLQERLGIPLELPDAERAREIQIPNFSADDAQALFTETDFLSLSKRLARLEDALSGRKA